MSGESMDETIRQDERELRHEAKKWLNVCKEFYGGDEEKCPALLYARLQWSAVYRLCNKLGIKTNPDD